MAEASISVNQNQFTCSVCLDLLKDAVTIPCSHSFCKVCINDCWDQQDQKDIYSCPQCRDTFTPRPVLRRNNMLAEVVEKLKKKTEVQAASPDHCYTGPGDVECDFCTGRKHKAIKSCLMCVASFCETHLNPHYQVPALKKHKLVEASGNLQEKICSEHDKVLEIFCHTDQSFICYLCMMDEHKSHDTVSVKAYRTEKEIALKEEQLKFQQRLQEKQKKVQELKQAVSTIKLSAQTAVEDNEMIFTEMISSMEKKRSEVTEMIRAQEKAELSRAERLLEQLEQEIDDLQRRVTEMEKLSHTRSHPFPPGNKGFSLWSVRKSLFDLKKRLEEICQEKFTKIPEDVEDVQILLLEPNSRDEFLKYFCDLTLDPNTVNHQLILSEKNRAVTYKSTVRLCDRKK
ncbi:tripartite motif-containing protein 16-like, partial [Tachysurus ichikawai]